MLMRRRVESLDEISVVSLGIPAYIHIGLTSLSQQVAAVAAPTLLWPLISAHRAGWPSSSSSSSQLNLAEVGRIVAW
jgi:hypothetical protein